MSSINNRINNWFKFYWYDEKMTLSHWRYCCLMQKSIESNVLSWSNSIVFVLFVFGCFCCLVFFFLLFSVLHRTNRVRCYNKINIPFKNFLYSSLFCFLFQISIGNTDHIYLLIYIHLIKTVLNSISSIELCVYNGDAHAVTYMKKFPTLYFITCCNYNKFAYTYNMKSKY